MAPTEAQRFELQQKLIEVLRERPANTLMESLPPMDWNELATKDDLAALEGRVNARFEVVDVRLEALRTELGAKIDTGLTGLNAKIDMGLTDLNAKIDTGLAGVHGDIAEVRGDIERVRGKIDSGLAKQTYVFLAGLAAAMTPIYLTLFAGLGT